jgi:hypothetical protein
MTKRQSNVNQLYKFINFAKTDEQKELIKQVIEHYGLCKIHKLITAQNLIKKIMNTKTSRQSVVKQLQLIEIKEPINTLQNTTNKLSQFITIKEQSCILDGLECVEYPNIEVLDKLINSDLLRVKTYEKDDFMMHYENERKHIEAYRAKVNDNKLIVKYRKYNSMKYGRVYCEDSLGAISLRKEIRGSLFVHKYVDLDMCNCHPNIFYRIAKLYKIGCPNLEQYIVNRDTILRSIMSYYGVDRDTAKDLIIRLLYLGGFKKWQIENKIHKSELPFITKLRKELSLIANSIISNNQLLVQRVKETSKKQMTKHKLKCRVVSYFNQEIECRILEQIYLFCKSKGYIKNNVCCLCYDGIMILIENYNNTILQEFSIVIYNKFGLKVKFEKKEMKHYLNILDDHVKPQRQTLKIDQRYLLDKDRLLNDNSLLVNQVKTFLEDKTTKSLNIKSPYDTGKTQLLKQIMTNYPQFNKMLMVTYRITLAYEFESVFEEFQFENYKNGNFKADHLINQTESLLKIADNADKLQKYDLIIIDESESVFNEFISPTFKGKSAKSFELLVALCKNPITKIITLDGDMSERSYTFVEYFGNACNIVNTCNFNTKTLNMYQGKKALMKFEKQMFNDLSNDLKLVIPVMSATYGIEMKKRINEQYSNKNVLIYTSTTSDNEKQDIKDIINKWSSADVLIYSPTIEAGVSFDVLGHFDKLYGYVCACSCSQRSFFQMMSRVRKFNFNDFHIYTDMNHDVKAKTWTFEEIDNKTLYNKDLVLQNEYEYDPVTDETLIIRKNELYRKIYIHNKVEENNKNSKCFMKIFNEIASKKGYIINVVNCDDDDDETLDKPSQRTPVVKGKQLLTKYLEILDAENISLQQYEEYKQLQKIGKATSEMKLAVHKRSIMNMLALDNLTYNDDSTKLKAYNIIKDTMNNSPFKNFTALIDEQNIKDADELQTISKKQFIVYVKQIINSLGFDHCFDKKQINNTDFEEKAKATCLLLSDLSKDSIFNQICNVTKEDLSYLENKTLSAQMRKFNTILNKCGIKVTSKATTKEKGTRKDINVYTLNVIDHVDEILSNKMTYTNFNLHDSSNIFQKVELNYFKEYITKDASLRTPVVKVPIDTSGLDYFID